MRGQGLGARALTWHEAEQRQQQGRQPGSAGGQVPLHSCSVPLGWAESAVLETGRSKAASPRRYPQDGEHRSAAGAPRAA